MFTYFWLDVLGSFLIGQNWGNLVSSHGRKCKAKLILVSSFQLGILSFLSLKKYMSLGFLMEDASSYVKTSNEQSRVNACQK
jgi:hypothetical protein